MILLILIGEILISFASFIWMIAMPGFADEAQRSRKANVAGKYAQGYVCLLQQYHYLLLFG